MAALLALHGLATPGFLFEYSGVLALTGGDDAPRRRRDPRVLGAAAAARGCAASSRCSCSRASCSRVVLGLGAARPSSSRASSRAVPAANSTEREGAARVGLGLFGVLAMRAFRTFLLTRRIADLVVTVGIVWLGTSLVAALTMTYAQLGWWLGHGLELDGILVVGIPVALDLARSVQSRPLAGDLDAVELVHSEERFLGSHVRALTIELGRRDAYTEQHTRRVALRAVQVGERLGLSKRHLRTLAIGGLLHDIGKLAVPDAILKKPGPLDDAEYAVDQAPPRVGHAAARPDRRLPEDGAAARPRPPRAARRPAATRTASRPTQIDLDTRILAVCDVYDALISSRVYRPPWTHQEAMALLREQVGTGFDARCVNALAEVLDREAGHEDELDRARANAAPKSLPGPPATAWAS